MDCDDKVIYVHTSNSHKVYRIFLHAKSQLYTLYTTPLVLPLLVPDNLHSTSCLYEFGYSKFFL